MTQAPKKADLPHPVGTALGQQEPVLRAPWLPSPASPFSSPLSSQQSCGAASPAWRSGSVTTTRPTWFREWGSHMIRNSQGQMWSLGRGSGKAVPKGCGCRKRGRERLARGVQAWFPGHEGNGTWVERGPGNAFTSRERACLHSVCSHGLFQTAGPASSHTVLVNTLSVACCPHGGTLLSAVALSPPRNGESLWGDQRA